jgi:hypothetical protein
VKFVVTTRKEILAELNSKGYTLVGVDGTVPEAKHLYDYLYDHHRHNGAEIQLDEMEELGFEPNEESGELCIVTTQVDADAIAAAFRIQFAEHFSFDSLPQYHNDPEKYQFLRAISYDCDHLAVPDNLQDYADSASMVVAALKEESKVVIDKLGLDHNHQQWTIEAKEAYGSACFARGVDCLSQLLNGKGDEWDYWTIARSYWQTVQGNIEQIVAEERIREYRDCLMFNQVGMVGYVDPRCWLRASQEKGFQPQHPVTVTQREVWAKGQFQGYAYTLGTIPLHPRQKAWDYTDGIFAALTRAERDYNQQHEGWGGQATVGGSGWNTTSRLTPEAIIDTVLAVVPYSIDAPWTHL